MNAESDSGYSTTRARVLGALLLLAVFTAGAMSGVAYTRMKRPGVNVNVRMVATDKLPRELQQLNPTPAQADSLRKVLHDGQLRTIRVLNDFEPRLRQAMDTLDAEIHAILTPDQRVKFDATRKQRIENNVERSIDTVRR